jgi:hypothetical protein
VRCTERKKADVSEYKGIVEGGKGTKQETDPKCNESTFELCSWNLPSSSSQLSGLNSLVKPGNGRGRKGEQGREEVERTARGKQQQETVSLTASDTIDGKRKVMGNATAGGS